MFSYKYITSGNKVIALSTYAGKVVRGIAKCNPADDFNIEKGKDIATARCAYKVAQKRFKRAQSKVEAAKSELEAAMNFYSRMTEYYTRAYEELETTKQALEDSVN